MTLLELTNLCTSEYVKLLVTDEKLHKLYVGNCGDIPANLWRSEIKRIEAGIYDGEVFGFTHGQCAGIEVVVCNTERLTNE